MNQRISHDAAPSHIGAAGLELGFDEGEDLSALAQETLCRGEHEVETDERDVYSHEIDLLG
jgi:hypothetical protein